MMWVICQCVPSADLPTTQKWEGWHIHEKNMLLSRGTWAGCSNDLTDLHEVLQEVQSCAPSEEQHQVLVHAEVDPAA